MLCSQESLELTIKNVLAAGTVALRWAAENELIGFNPAPALVKFSVTPAKRGVLMEEEVRRLFAQPRERRSRLAFRVLDR